MSGTQTHTPGPWDIIGNTSIYGEGAKDSRVKVAEVDTNRYSYQAEDHEANARLIASAPDLLAALKEARDLLASLPADLKELETMGAEDTACKMLEAIAKAEGGAS